MENNSCFKPPRKLEGNWMAYPYRNGNEIVREEYISDETSIRLVLSKGEGFWVSEIFWEDYAGEELLDKGKYFGLDSYRKAHDFISFFTTQMKKDVGLEELAMDFSSYEPYSS